MPNSKYDAVVLMNLGSPDSPSQKDVKKYLSEFLMDERVIDYAYIFRFLLVRGIIVPFRTKNSAHAYSRVWKEDVSPLISLTMQLQKQVQSLVDVPVEIAMRYGNPTVQSAFDAIKAKVPGAKNVLAIPLYPHYAMSSYETAVEQAKSVLSKSKYSFNLEFIPPFYNEPNYIDALAESIKPYISKPYDKILFSYHGLPQRHLTKGDPTKTHCVVSGDCCNVDSVAHKTCYKHQCFTTTKLVVSKLNIPAEKVENSFQSRLGREQWIPPYTVDRLTAMPAEGVKHLVVLCPAFVSDCLETLEEIAMEGKKTFLEAGGESFELIPCLNTHPDWVNTVAGWVN